MKNRPPEADFCISIDFKPGTPDPARIFRAMTSLIDNFNVIDRDLIQSISGDIQPILLLEDIRTGSLQAWLKQALEMIDDDAIKNLDWRPAIGKYLVRAKYIMVNFLEKNVTVSDRKQITEIKEDLLKAAEETEVLHLPIYTPLPDAKIAEDLRLLSEATGHLTTDDSVKYISAEGEASFNLQFAISPEAIEDLLTEETIVSTNEMILKVKKPDFLGDSMWDFKHGSRPIPAKILDQVWLKRFQDRLEDVRPGDALRASVEIEAKYGYDREIVATHYRVVKVHTVLKVPLSSSGNLFE